jgi:hypothetical protein
MLNREVLYFSIRCVRWRKNLEMLERSNAFLENPLRQTKRKTPKIVKRQKSLDADSKKVMRRVVLLIVQVVGNNCVAEAWSYREVGS